ncbi:Cytochrome c oxidase assembly protein cox15 [Hanseniaspora osmophila]
MFRNIVSLKQGVRALSLFNSTASKNARISTSTATLFSKSFSPSLKSMTASVCTSISSKSTLQRRFFQTKNSKLYSTVQEEAQSARPQRKTRRLMNSHSNVGYWLIGTSGLVFGIVVLGGLTRLTESGLSITEWKPVTGTIPPLNQKEWEEEFAKYKDSPEFKQLNSHITLDEFKFIFFMEWFHRLWGRAIGGIFVVPTLYLLASRYTSARVNRRLLGLSALLGLQGVIGWWMVKSGLDEENLEERKSKPTVSQYRLTTHLGAAFMLYMGMLWTGWEIVRENKWMKNPSESIKIFEKLNNPQLKPLKKMSLALVALTFLTAMSGGLVAGLDAGLIYNTFPKMGDTWFPSKRELLDKNFSRKEDNSDLVVRNVLDNPTTVQLNHRILAITTFTAVLAFHMYAVKRKALIPKNVNRTIHAMMGLVTLQAALGIATLVYLVPISLASAHQAGALALLTSTLLCASQLRRPRPIMQQLIMNLQKNGIPQKTGSKILRQINGMPMKS